MAINSKSRILPNILHCENNRKSKLHWPNSLPFPKDWIFIWRNILLTIIAPTLQTSPLGAWKAKSHQLWPAKVSYTNKYIHTDNKMYVLEKASRRNVYAESNHQVECSLLADITYHNNTISLIGSGLPYHDPPPPPPLTTAWEFFQSAPTWQKKNWDAAPITKTTLNIIADELKNDNILCAGDGSVLYGRAAHAWCIFRKSDYK